MAARTERAIGKWQQSRTGMIMRRVVSTLPSGGSVAVPVRLGLAQMLRAAFTMYEAHASFPAPSETGPEHRAPLPLPHARGVAHPITSRPDVWHVQVQGASQYLQCGSLPSPRARWAEPHVLCSRWRQAVERYT